MKPELTLERLKERLSYDPETGIFEWLETHGGTSRKGWSAGRLGMGKNAGWKRVTVDGRDYRSGRLAWFYMTGKWPVDQVDHINGDKSDDRWANLREATQSQNKANSRRYRNNKSGVKGVCWNPEHQKWQSTIYVDGKQKFLGRFSDIKDATKAYQLAAEEYFGKYHRKS